MGKANRLKKGKAEQALTSPTQKKTTQGGMPTWLGTVIVVTVLLALVLTAAFFALDGAGTFDRMRVVMETDHFEITAPMMSYLVYNEYHSLIAQYEEYKQTIGFAVNMPTGKGGEQLVDISQKPLRQQYYATQDDNGLTLETPVTWFDHFAEEAMKTVATKLVICEEAYEKDIELEEGEEQSVQMAIDQIAAYAAYYQTTTYAYITTLYGEDVREQDIRDMLEIEALYYKYSQQRAEEFIDGVSPEQVQTEYDTNPSKYDVYVDYITYTFKATFTASTNSDSAVAKTENEQNAEKYEAKKAKYRALLDELEAAAKTSPDTYKEKLLAVLKEVFFDEEKESALAAKEAGAELTADEIEACRTAADKKAANAIDTADRKNVDTESTQSPLNTTFKTWLTDKNTPKKAGDVYTNVSDYNAFNEDVTSKEEQTEGSTENATPKDYENATSTYEITLLKSGLQRIDGNLRSVGHILFSSETFTDSKTGEALTTSTSFSGVMKTLADRVLAKHGKLTSEYMAAELILLMTEKGDLVEKTENGVTYYEMDPAVFEAYGNQYTSDGNVLYDNVYQGQMVKSFENWMFDGGRILNEVTPTAVETSYGHHIMIYRGDEKVAWSYKLKVELAEGRYDAWVEQLKETIEVTYKTSNLAYINA